MANKEQLEILKSGVENWNEWRIENPNEMISLENANLREANLRGANLREANLRGADLRRADLREAVLSEAYLIRAYLTEANLSEADLSEADLSEASLREANLSKAHLCEAKLCWADLRRADFCEANLSEANLSRANLSEANLSMGYLCGADLKETNLSKADFNKACLSWTDLSWAILIKANLIEADLSEADLSEANLRKANLSGANLSGANLSGANLSETNLNSADLNSAILNRAYFFKTDLLRAVFYDAYLGHTTFSDVDLSVVIGIDFCSHFNNSYIDFHSLKNSKKLPPAFFRGCGLSDDFIKNIPSLFEQPPLFYSCFISYSTKDQAFVERLFSDLQNKGIRAWYAPHDLKAGQKIIEQIDTGIKVTDKLLLILSKNSIGSEWEKTEITKAFKKSKVLGKQVLFPISITEFEKLKDWEYFDADFGIDLAKELREYYLLNIENWKDHDEYKKNFEKLVDSLRIESVTNA